MWESEIFLWRNQPRTGSRESLLYDVKWPVAQSLWLIREVVKNFKVAEEPIMFIWFICEVVKMFQSCRGAYNVHMVHM